MAVSVTVIDRPTYASLTRAVQEQASSGSAVLLLLGAQAGLDVELLHHHLCSTSALFAGAVVPGVIWETRVHTAGALICRVPCDDEPTIVNPLSLRSRDLPVNILRWAEASSSCEGATLLILVDGLAAQISEFLLALSGYLGPRVAYVGGGAASMDYARRPCLLTRAAVFGGGAIVLRIRMTARCAVGHGWVPVGEPMMVTRSAGNVVGELNWRPAFDVYRQTLLETCGQAIEQKDFSRVSPRHPLGIVREHAEHLVRDPIAVDSGGSLVCVGAVPENALVHLMEGRSESLIRAATQVTREALTGLGAPCSLLWVSDCVSRCGYLGEKFDDELAAIRDESRKQGFTGQMCGFLSFGEIAESSSGALNFHNKTVVAAALYE